MTANRRTQVLASIGDGIGIIPTAPQKRRNSDVLYPFRPDSDFYYLTHFPEPEAVVVLAPGSKFGDYILFCRERDPKMEIWDGRRAGVEGAVEHYKADCAYAISKLDEYLPQLMEERERIYYPVGRYAEYDEMVVKWLNTARRRGRSGIRSPGEIVDIGQILHKMRLFKQPDEIEIIKQAAEISATAHRQAMLTSQPGMTEYGVQAEIERCFRQHGCEPAYPSIVASGENACVLHYIENSDELRDGALLLVDAGAELDCYASDITRTFPINGQFSGPQRAVYEVVLEAQKCAIEAARPGNRYNDVNDAATEVLVEGLISLGILKDSKDEALEKKTYQTYYMHKIGHWIGLDVHDVGTYRDDVGWRKLEPNIYMTIEPGLYLSPSEELDSKWHGIGIRIEDDVLITETGPLILTSNVPKEISEIEQLMSD